MRLYKHGCIKSEFTTDNYSIDSPISFNSKWYVFEHIASYAFCQVFSMSVTFKIGQNDFDVVFLQYNSKKLSCFRYKLLCNKDIFQIMCLS